VTRFILDTNTVSDFIDRREPLYSRVLAAGEAVATTVITLDESLTGWYNLIRKAKKPDRVVWAYDKLAHATVHLAKLPILAFTLSAYTVSDQLRGLKLNVGSDDLRIAAIALEHGATVVTANVRDFARVPGLPVEDWTQPAA
jgi:tRNA(fMet)-specific endonuclease VapC